MFEIREFCDRINVDKPNIFLECQDLGSISADATTVEELDEEERNIYDEAVKKYYDAYKTTWKDVIQEYMKYKRPNLVNA